MILRAVLVALVTLFATSASAQPPGMSAPKVDLAKLSAEYPVVELVTMGIGGLIWERHGHIAMCVRYPNPRQDVCYNYGIGDFRHPLKMTWGFFRGTNSFWVGKGPRRDMLAIYQWADRTIWVQPLPLTPEQKSVVLAKLEVDILDTNKYYSYDHFFDNCTTRVRDIIDSAIGGKLKAMPGKVDEGRTFRDLARDGFYGMQIPLLITDFAMGRITDRVPTYWERMFLPQYLREAVRELWGIEPFVEYQRRGPLAEAEAESEFRRGVPGVKKPPPLDDGPDGKLKFVLFTLALTLPAWLFKVLGRLNVSESMKRVFAKLEKPGLVFAFVPYILLGVIFTFLAIISPLPYVRANESILVLFPGDLVLPFLSPRRRMLYARGRVAMLGLLFLLSLVNVIKQPLIPLMFWPLVPLAVVAFWPRKT
jgi:hypothetical protein